MAVLDTAIHALRFEPRVIAQASWYQTHLHETNLAAVTQIAMPSVCVSKLTITKKIQLPESTKS
jgi:hypothetical protein